MTINVSALSREDLVDEMLASASPSRPLPHADLLRVGDAGPLTVHPRPASEKSLLAHRLSVARELLLRDLREQMRRGPMMDSPQALRDWLRLYCADLQHEVFLVLFLDTHLRLLEVEPMFRGTISQTAVYPREVVKAALARNAAAVAFAHNHPSGAAEPSRADEYLTSTLRSALALVDVRVIDHFIVAGDQIASFAELGML